MGNDGEIERVGDGKRASVARRRVEVGTLVVFDFVMLDEPAFALHRLAVSIACVQVDVVVGGARAGATRRRE